MTARDYLVLGQKPGDFGESLTNHWDQVLPRALTLLDLDYVITLVVLALVGVILMTFQLLI